MAAPKNASVAFIFVVLLLDTLGIGLIIPVLPRLIDDIIEGDLTVASRYFGALVALYSAVQFVCAPILGALSDRFGRRAVILSSLLGAALNYVLLALAPNLAWLVVGRVIAGATGASFSAATAYIADVTPAEKRAAAFGLVGAAFGLGFIIGPALGGLLGGVSLRAPFVVAAGLNGLNVVYGLFVLPESLAPENRRAFSFRRANPLASLKNLTRSPTLLGLSGTIICAYTAQMILQSVWALHTQARFGWSPFNIGISLAVVGLASGLVQAGLVRVAIPKLGEPRAVLVGLVFSVTGYIAMGAATEGWMMYVLIFPFAIGGISGPAVQAILTREVGASEQGELQGTLVSLQSLTAIFGPILATSLFARFAPETAVPRIPGAAFYAAAMLNAIGFVLAWRLFARLKLKATA